MSASLRLIAENVRLQLWLIPMAAALLAAAAAALAVLVEADGYFTPAFDIDVSAANGVLSAISTAMISFTALVFSVTMLVLQQASSQLSPRVTRTFLRDRFNQVILGLFVATFVFSLLILLSTSQDFVPQLGLAISLLLMLAAVLGFVVYLDHIANAIRASTVIEAIASETASIIERLYQDDESGPSADVTEGEFDGLPAVSETIRSPHHSGYVVSIDETRLAEAAARGDQVIELLVAVGDYLVKAEPLLAVRGGASDEDELSDAIVTAKERAMAQDPLFGFRQLVDIALRALSPAINDPATAVQVIERLHVLLRQLMPLRLRAPALIRHRAAIRAVVPGPDWAAFVGAAVDEISAAADGNELVGDAQRTMLRALIVDAEPDRALVLREALTRLGRRHDGGTST